MAEIRTISDLKNESNPTIRYWAERNKKMKEWYKLIQMKDELAKEGMESFVGNDPRSSFNFVLNMLDESIPHRIPAEDLTADLLPVSSDIEGFYSTAWRDVYKRYRKRGKSSWMRNFLAFLLSTGWTSVFAQVTPDGTRCMAEVWNPASVFPNWDDELWQLVHVFQVSPLQAQGLIRRNKWNVKVPATRIEVRDFWYLDDGGKVHNVIGLGDQIAKPDTIESRFKSTGIPVMVSPCAGLPDDGILGADVGDHVRDLGQSIVATNEHIYRSWNKWWTFSMQLLRDTAQPRWFEKSRSSTPILRQADLFKRGAIFKGGPEDSIQALDVPPIPVEIRGSQLDMEAMMERGGVSWAAQGNFKGQLTSYVMAQVIASTAQVARPFHQTAKDTLSDIDNLWLTMCREQGHKPYGFTVPKELTSDIEITADYEVKIPGDLLQRATIAKMLDPHFRLSTQFIIANLFPEIKNPLRELALVRSDDAQRHEVNAMIALVEYFEQEAAVAKNQGNGSASELYLKAAARVKATIDMSLGAGQPQPGMNGSNGSGEIPGMFPTVYPPQSIRPQGGE